MFNDDSFVYSQRVLPLNATLPNSNQQVSFGAQNPVVGSNGLSGGVSQFLW